MVRCPLGDPLYPLGRTGPVVPAHPGDDRERICRAGSLKDALCPAPLALLRARRLCADPLALSPLDLPDERRARARFDDGAALRAGDRVVHSACRHITRLRRAVARAPFFVIRCASL